VPDIADLNNDIMSSEIVVFIPDEQSIRERRRLSDETSAKGWVQLFVTTRTDGYRKGDLSVLTAEELLAVTEALSSLKCMVCSPCWENKNVLTIKKLL